MPAISHAISVWPSPTWPVGRRGGTFSVGLTSESRCAEQDEHANKEKMRSSHISSYFANPLAFSFTLGYPLF